MNILYFVVFSTYVITSRKSPFLIAFHHLCFFPLLNVWLLITKIRVKLLGRTKISIYWNFSSEGLLMVLKIKILLMVFGQVWVGLAHFGFRFIKTNPTKTPKIKKWAKTSKKGTRLLYENPIKYLLFFSFCCYSGNTNTISSVKISGV